MDKRYLIAFVLLAGCGPTKFFVPEVPVMNCESSRFMVSQTPAYFPSQKMVLTPSKAIPMFYADGLVDESMETKHISMPISDTNAKGIYVLTSEKTGCSISVDYSADTAHLYCQKLDVFWNCKKGN